MDSISLRSLFAAGLLCCAAGLPAAQAAPTDPVVVELPDDALGAAFSPGFRLVADLEPAWVEQEFLVRGTADLFNYASNPPAGPDDIEAVSSGVPWATRIVVRRPSNPRRFNGSVVVEWLNSTAGFDSAPSWDVSAEYFAREGFIYIGYTNAINAIAFLTGGCSVFGVLPPTCGTRYASLSLPDDGLAYEIANQISNLVREGGADSPIPRRYRVRRIYHVGQSQQAGSVITYASAFHEPGLVDGYFVQANIFARRIKDGTDCAAGGAPAFPDCVPRLAGDDRFVRTDLPVPVVQALTETDVVALWGIGGRQSDTPSFRYYEVAGTAHLTIHKGVEVLPAGSVGPDPLMLEDLCLNPLNTSADGPVFASYPFNAMWRNLEQQVRVGTAPPAGRTIATDLVGVVERDGFGNALGGVRQPAMDVPIATYDPPTNVADPALPEFLRNIGNLACRLGGSLTPFDETTLADLYPSHGQYVREVIDAANEAYQERLLLGEDWRKIVVEAAHAPIGAHACGLGFELTLLLVPIAWLRGRRQARRHRA